MGLPDVHDRVGEAEHRLIIVDAEAGTGTGLGAVAEMRLRTLPAVVLSVGGLDRAPRWSDAALGRDGAVDRADIDGIRTTVSANPLASVALALLLRSSGDLDIGAGLAAESAVYSMLQSGPEFATWRAGRPVRHRRPGEVRVHRHGGLLRVVLDRPDTHNAFNTAMRDGLVDALQLAALDPSITEVELGGAGPSFCSGGDLDEFGSRADPASAHLVRLTRSAGRLMAELADSTTVRIHGATMGSGIELAAFAHRVIADHDTTIALPEVGLGLIPGAGGTVSLPRRIGRHRTMQLALSQRSIDARTALDWGLVDEIAG